MEDMAPAYPKGRREASGHYRRLEIDDAPGVFQRLLEAASSDVSAA
jgi:hypothetical protein